MRRLSEMVLVIVAALVFLSAAFTLRSALPLAFSAVVSPRSHGAPPIGPAEPVLAPVPDPSPPTTVEPVPLPPLSEVRFFRL